MTPEFITAARAEAATLQRRLTAVQELLAAYGDDVQDTVPARAAPSNPYKVAEDLKAIGSDTKPRSWGDRPKDQFSPYGRAVVEAAVSVVRAAEQLPIKTRDIAERLQSNGVEIRGNDPVNALGALLARSSDIESRGKQGWTPVNGYGVIPPNENGAAEAAPDAEEVGASSDDTKSVHDLLG